MSTPAKKIQGAAQLEDSAMWQLAKEIATKTRELVNTVPYQEYYAFSSNTNQSATSVASDIAMAVGKNWGATAFDYRFARGHLFTLKGLLLMAEELDFVQSTKDVMRDIAKLQDLIEKEIAKLEKTEQA